MDPWKLVNLASVIIAIYGGYLSAMRHIDRRIRALELKIAIIVERDRMRRLQDYAEDKGPDPILGSGEADDSSAEGK